MPLPRPAHADPHDRSSSLARGAALTVALLATVGTLALAAQLLLQDRATAPHPALPWLLAVGLACSSTGAGWVLWRQRELANALREARLEASAWRGLVDAWQWRTDGAHRLTQWRPPLRANDVEWASEGAVGKAAWEHFGTDAVAAASLRGRLDSGAPLDGLKVWCRHGESGHRQFELRAVALTDAHGRSAGYIGVATAPRPDTDPEADGRLLQTVLMALPIPAFVLSGDRRAPSLVRCANDAASHCLGVTASQLAGLSWSDLLARLPKDLRAQVTLALAAAVNDAEAPPCAGWDVRVRRLGDELRASPAAHGAGQLWTLTLLAGAAADAAPAPAIAEHESFSYTVSHDLRAPIRVVEGFTKILKEDYGRQLDRIGNDHLDRVLGAAARMNSMIDALLALSQLSSRPLSRKPVNLSQLATYVIDDLRRQSPERSVAVHIAPGLQAQGDPTLVRMVLENLLGNAWKYSAKRTHAEVWLERGQSEGQAVFTVRDNGAGFDMRFADRLFGVFQRLHSATDFPGTGVGLASVRRIVGRHGGEIWAESTVDRGSAFHFTLPASGTSAG